MSSSTPRLSLPLLLPAQAQKHVTHNEAIAALDALVQLTLTDIDTNAPPAIPEDGAVYAVGDSPTGDWAGEAGNLAFRQNGGWSFAIPQTGWFAWSLSQGALVAFENGTWVQIGSSNTNLDGVGVQTNWDMTNRLSVSAEATLLSHDGAGHQLKINKSQSADTASLLFQNDFVGHAEMGLAGNEAFSIKVSGDGVNWDAALAIDPVTQTIESPYVLTGTAVQQSPDDVTPGRLMKAEWGYGPATVVGAVSETAGIPTGAVIETGNTVDGNYTRWADGTQICWHRGNLTWFNATRLQFDWTFPLPFSDQFDPVLSANLQNEFGTQPGPTALHGPHARQGNNSNHLNCSVRIYCSDGTAFDAIDTLPFHVMATGRWY